MNPNKRQRITILDTTLRDGEQAPGFHMTPAVKVRIARQLARLKVDVIEAGFPASSAADARAVAAVARAVGRGKNAPEICALARCVDGDIDAAVDAVKGASRARVHVFIATSAIHMEKKLKMSPAEVLNRIDRSVRRAAQAGVHVQFSAEDASRSDKAFLAEAVRVAIAAGARTINIPDTVGYAMPHEHGARIREVMERVPETRRVVMSVHCHDDLGMATANSFAAVISGARQVECAINGIGERAGNCATEEIVMALATRGQAAGFWTGVERTELMKTSHLVARSVGVAVAPNKAVVGRNAFAHASGIHQDGMVKDRETYEIMRPADVGAEGTTLVLTARSGRRAVAERLRALGKKLDVSAFDRVFTRFKRVADRRREVGDQELLRLARS